MYLQLVDASTVCSDRQKQMFGKMKNPMFQVIIQQTFIATLIMQQIYIGTSNAYKYCKNVSI